MYFSTEKLTCFVCKEEGHLAKHCKNAGANIRESQDSVSRETQNDHGGHVDMSQINEVDNNASQDMPPPINTKRPLSSTASSKSYPKLINTGNKDEEKKTKIVQQVPKRAKRGPDAKVLSISDIVQKLLPARDNILSNAQKYPLDFESFVSFV